MPKILVETKGLKKYFKTPYGRLHAVDGVDLIIREGQTLGVVGESGCGKSTLGRTILKLINPTDGQIIYDGKDITNLSAHKMKPYRKEMQMIFQDPYSSINPRMSVAQLIAEPIIINGIAKGAEAHKLVQKMMDTVGLASRLENAYPHELDGGRRQRIGVARALSLSPKFIVCDEPVSALDVSIQAQILNLLMDLQDEYKLTYMFITHDMSVVKHISDEIMVMYLGECVERAETEKLFDKQIHPYTQALMNSIPIPDLAYADKAETILFGEITSPIEPEEGCRFRSRCQIGFDCIGKENNELFEIEPNHFCSCRKRIRSHYAVKAKRPKTTILQSANLNGKECNIILANGKVLMVTETTMPVSKDFVTIDATGLTVKYGEIDKNSVVVSESIKDIISADDGANLLLYKGIELKIAFIKGQKFTLSDLAFKAKLINNI